MLEVGHSGICSEIPWASDQDRVRDCHPVPNPSKLRGAQLSLPFNCLHS